METWGSAGFLFILQLLRHQEGIVMVATSRIQTSGPMTAEVVVLTVLMVNIFMLRDSSNASENPVLGGQAMGIIFGDLGCTLLLWLSQDFLSTHYYC